MKKFNHHFLGNLAEFIWPTLVYLGRITNGQHDKNLQDQNLYQHCM